MAMSDCEVKLTEILKKMSEFVPPEMGGMMVLFTSENQMQYNAAMVVSKRPADPSVELSKQEISEIIAESDDGLMNAIKSLMDRDKRTACVIVNASFNHLQEMGKIIRQTEGKMKS